MKLSHIALYVSDLERMKDFYTHFFNATANAKYHNLGTGLQTYFLTFAGETRLEIMSRPELVVQQKQQFLSGYSHIAFQLGSKEKVDALTNVLREAGFAVLSGPRTTGDGYYESVVLDPEGNFIELTA